MSNLKKKYRMVKILDESKHIKQRIIKLFISFCILISIFIIISIIGMILEIWLPKTIAIIVNILNYEKV